ncbi:MAG: 50S ribosomal protein L23, partial [Parcubacteria group bacterium CG_4_10_14_0_2_um_filter_7_35_8]
MAFNLFKKKKDGASKSLAKPASSAGVPERRKLVTFDSSSILVSPHVTEKATMLSSDNQYVFKVFPRANKTEIKRAIESLYNVKVIGV